MQENNGKKEIELIEEKQKLIESEACFRDFAEAAADCFWEADVALNMTKVVGDANGFDFVSLVDVANAAYSHSANEMLKTMQLHQKFSDYIVQIQAVADTQAYLRVAGKPVLDQDGNFFGYRGICKDVTETIISSQRVAFLASHDELTGLPNRNMFRQRLEHAIIKAKRLAHQLLLIFFDLDYFKVINDTLGQEAGDQLLILATERIAGCARSTDVLCRLGSDEFVMMMEGTSPEDGHRILREIIDAFSFPFEINNQQLHCTVSMGVSVYPDDTGDPEVLLLNADLAMIRAKQSGRNNFEFFTADLNDIAHQWFEMANDIRHGLEEEQFFLVYQPQIHYKTKKTVGFEALLRWRHPKRGLIPPLEFFSVAEKSLLIDQMGELVLEMACAQIRQWLDAGFKVPRVSINISARYLRSNTIIDSLNSITSKYKISPKALCIEIAEHALLEDIKEVKNNIRAIKDAGYYLSLDDFGMGRSSLLYLKRKIVDEVKIDRAFISGIENNEEDRVIVKAIAALGSTLGLNLIAEGVENEEQSKILAKSGYKTMQGHFYASPLAVIEVEKILKR